MCGIVGYAGFDNTDLLERMCSTVRHRGPDDDGFYRSKGVGLGNRRLSIIDIAGGHQPIKNEDGRVVVVQNGEIYNFRELFDILRKKGHHFKTRSDTETIVHAYEEFGPDFLHYLNGMFAIALYDEEHRLLLIARDRLGEKPLYYTFQNGKLVFASEIKALLEYEGLSRSPNLPLMEVYLAYRFVPGPGTLFEGIQKLPAAHRLVYSDHQIKVEPYWRMPEPPTRFERDELYYERFGELLESSVRMRLVSDVPFGAFLSGGVDSSIVVGLMSRELKSPVKTFSVGFDSPRDEVTAARRVAQRFECDHTEVICRPADLALLPKVVWHLDEPIGDAIVLPMYLLSQAARKSVKMVLTGEGADEGLAGYFFHKVLYWHNVYQRRVPRFIRRQVVRPVLSALPARLLNMGFSYPAALGNKGKEKALRSLDELEDASCEQSYYILISLFDRKECETLWIRPPVAAQSVASARADNASHNYLERLLRVQYSSWLPDDILTKQDKMTMANSIEGRVPFLDHRLVEFVATLPPHLKLRGLTDKYLLRRYARTLLLNSTSRRTKQPFYMPAEKYFNCPEFRTLLRETLSEAQVRKRGLFRWEAIRELLARAGSGEFVYAKQIVSLICLELWHQIFIDRSRQMNPEVCVGH